MFLKTVDYHNRLFFSFYLSNIKKIIDKLITGIRSLMGSERINSILNYSKYCIKKTISILYMFITTVLTEILIRKIKKKVVK